MSATGATWSAMQTFGSAEKGGFQTLALMARWPVSMLNVRKSASQSLTDSGEVEIIELNLNIEAGGAT